MNNYKSGFVTLLGRPNVGKSTLINKLIGEKITITSPVAQTTRNKLKGINESIKFANKEDIVLIAGKGHEDYQILNDKVIDFDDRKIAQKLLQEKSKSK